MTNRLYGNMPMTATKEIHDICKKEECNLSEFWASFGLFMYKYYKTKDNGVKIRKVAKKMTKSYNDQHHSGYSHLVVTQKIMAFLSGEMNELSKGKILGQIDIK